MALRLDKSVVRGEIDNRLQDYVMGKIWFVGRSEPVRLSLKGNCLRDIAGTRIVFENPRPEPGQRGDALASLQEGKAGDMTASRKVRVMNMPVEEAYELRKAGKEVPLRMANSIYLEWFSETNGRVVIEATNFQVIDLSEPSWRMSREEEREQLASNMIAIGEYIANASEERETVRETGFEEYEPMDEFEWEKGLKESDALTDKYSDLLEMYMDHPNRDKVVARKMGWTWLDDALDADERGVFDEEKLEMDDIPDLVPNPLTEGTDWIRTEDGRVKHPLSYRAFEVAMDMWHYCQNLGMMEDNGDSDLHDMLFEAQVLGAKLAGALDSLAYDHQPEGGFVVACLKRGLQYFQKSIAAAEKVREKGLLEEMEKLETFRQELFKIREEMLNLMKYYRGLQL